TKGGATIDYKGAGVGGTTGGGVTGGKAVGGIQVTGPGGREATKVGTAGGAVGPGGNAVGGKQGGVAGRGPGGRKAGQGQGGVAIGPTAPWRAVHARALLRDPAAPSPAAHVLALPAGPTALRQAARPRSRAVELITARRPRFALRALTSAVRSAITGASVP